MTRLEIMVAFARTITWSCAEDLLHPQVRDCYPGPDAVLT